MNSHPWGFTLIELLVVIGVMSLLMAMAFSVTAPSTRKALVQSEAERLSRTLVQARSLAMSTGSEHAVVFNIQNPPGSSGRILSNQAGGHWYRILGPTNLGNTAEKSGLIPHPERLWQQLPNLGELMDQVDACWHGPAQVLPAKQVRFLALGDTDEGCRKGMGTSSYVTHTSSPTLIAPVGYQATYPRPYFGVYSPTTRRLYTWGGYEGPDVTFRDPHRNILTGPIDPIIPNPVPYTGFYYGADGGVDGCVNTSNRSYTTYRDVNVDDILTPNEQISYAVLKKGDPRPLVNARWLDAVIVFDPEGTARFLEWNAGRRAYRNAAVPVPNLPDPYDGTPAKWPYENGSRQHGGVRDLCKHYESGSPLITGCTNLRPSGEANNMPCEYDTAEVGHFTAHTRGWRISLAPDVDPDADTFDTAKAALASLFPLWRVEVSQAGGVRLFEVRRDTSAIAGITRWPASPSVWQDATAVQNNCAMGWLHRVPKPWLSTNTKRPALAGMYASSAPRGRPILDCIDELMLTQQQWWLDP